MNDRELQILLRQSARRRPAGLPADFSTGLFERIRARELASRILPVLTAASALALVLSMAIASWHQAVPPTGAPPELTLFWGNSEHAPFSSP